MTKTKIRFEILFISILLIVISGCTEKDDRSEVISGTEGLTIEFVNGLPQDNYKVGSQEFPISIFIDVKNKGTYPQEDIIDQSLLGSGKIFLSGFDTSIIDLEQNSKDLSELYLPGKSSVNPEGGLDSLEFNGNIIAQNLGVEKYTPTILATLCYPYVTKLSPAICVDPSPFNNEQDKVCEIGTVELTSQGGPIAVTSIDEEAFSGKLRLKINLKHFGSGDVFNFDSLDKCGFSGSSRLQRNDFNFLR